MNKETVDDFIAAQVEAIDEKITEINSSKIIRAAEKMIAKRNDLMAARRALLGVGSKTSGNPGNRVTQAEVVEYMMRDQAKGWGVSELAEAMGHSPEVIRGHLNRGKNERFVQENGEWLLRDPEND